MSRLIGHRIAVLNVQRDGGLYGFDDADKRQVGVAVKVKIQSTRWMNSEALGTLVPDAVSKTLCHPLSGFERRSDAGNFERRHRGCGEEPAARTRHPARDTRRSSAPRGIGRNSGVGIHLSIQF